MAGRLIHFDTEAVRKILSGKKTQVRRVVNNIPLREPYFEVEDGEPFACDVNGDWFPAARFCPYQRGDTMWARESWAKDAGRYIYRADYNDDEKFYINGNEVKIKWESSTHMPHNAVRLFLCVKNVRMERLQDIGIQDIKAEGITVSSVPLMICDFKYVWDSSIRKTKRYKYGWEANPWVWRIEFERVKQAS